MLALINCMQIKKPLKAFQRLFYLSLSIKAYFSRIIFLVALYLEEVKACRKLFSGPCERKE